MKYVVIQNKFLVCSYFTQNLSTLFYSKFSYAVYIICLTSDIKCHLFQWLTYIHHSTMIRPFEGNNIHNTFLGLPSFSRNLWMLVHSNLSYAAYGYVNCARNLFSSSFLLTSAKDVFHICKSRLKYVSTLMLNRMF